MRALLRRRRSSWTISAAILFSIATVSFAALAQTGRLKLVSTAWSPFTNDAGKPRFALDLVESAFTRLGMSATTSIVDAGDFTASLLTGPFDGSAAAWKDTERERVLLFSKPYLENRLVLVGRRGAVVSAKSFAELKGKRIAVVGGYSYAEGLDLMGPVFVRSRSEEDSVSLLLAGKVDYTLMDELVVQYIVTNHPAEAQQKLQLGSTALLKRPLSLAVRRSVPGAESIIARFNDELRNMIVDRTYHELLRVEWISADIDGDGVPELVPRSDQAGTTEPRQYYLLVSPEKPTGSQKIYVGKTLYNSWDEVPESYKVSASGRKTPNQNTIAAFTFTWK